MKGACNAPILPAGTRWSPASDRPVARGRPAVDFSLCVPAAAYSLAATPSDRTAWVLAADRGSGCVVPGRFCPGCSSLPYSPRAVGELAARGDPGGEGGHVEYP